jgi:uncharacterized protein DUF1828
LETENIISDILSRICSGIEVLPEGLDRYLIITPFVFDDGDSIKIVLKDYGSKNPYLTDEGHTLMHLSYNNVNIDSGSRSQLFEDILSRNLIRNEDGELIQKISDVKDLGDNVYTYVQGLLNVSDLEYLKRERVRSTFYEDVKGFITERFPDTNVLFDHTIEEKDHQGLYPVDCVIKSGKRDIFLFSILNDDKCRDATISMLQFEKYGIEFNSIAIFQNQEEINRKVLSRFTDVCEKQFSTLDSAKERICRYVEART